MVSLLENCFDPFVSMDLDEDFGVDDNPFDEIDSSFFIIDEMQIDASTAEYDPVAFNDDAVYQPFSAASHPLEVLCERIVVDAAPSASVENAFALANSGSTLLSIERGFQDSLEASNDNLRGPERGPTP
ncbi:hypothetical protein NLG97_g8047 [Lecanicillium saksenae]|uniref:Uncharacterized protein n=1 Tax=Lecanicillium saksenae TaxID=468837 RepID=A0ACC1QK49_9HYPO|nr:hypothetical protein NLG97_g8047 [Lecanicillium saksenae]